MDSLSPSAQKGNSPIYTIYALIDPHASVVRYIGMSTDVLSRYAQHLACSDATHADKNEWIRGLLVMGILPRLKELEAVATIDEAREREQFWIRRSMVEGAQLFNRAITYTEDERYQAKIDRAILDAKVAELFRQGIFVKYGWFAPTTSVKEREKRHEIHLLDFPTLYFKDRQGQLCNVERASHADFDRFIRQYIPVEDRGLTEWRMDDRLNALNFAFYYDKPVELYCAQSLNP